MPQYLNKLTPRQIEYLNDDHRFVVVTAGRRSRKTLIGKRKTLIRALEKKGRYFQAAPVHTQAKNIFWDDLKRETKHLRLQPPNETYRYVTLLNGSEIHVLGLDKPERIEGQVWHGGHISEIANVKSGAWEANIRPVLSDTNGWCILDGVPEGRNHLYDLALKACDEAIPDTIPFVGAKGTTPRDKDWVYYSWHSADVLNPGEMISAKNSMDERTFRQEYEGSFEDLQGLLYYAYGDHNVSDCVYDKSQIVHIGVDFNVNPMTAVFCHVRGDEVHQFGEYYMPNSNTYELRDYIRENYPYSKVRIYPDSTGKARESNATESDLEILSKAGTVYANSINPRVKDRVTAVNTLMRSADMTVRYKVNIRNCPKTVNDFNRVNAKDDGTENKTQEAEGLVHISSALGYLIAYKFPVRDNSVTTVRIRQ